MFSMHYLYKITCLLNNKVYIGQCVNPKKRWNAHKSSAKKPEKYHTIIARALAKYGIDNFIYDVIAQSQTQEDADWAEERLIIQYSSRNPNVGYNIMPGGNTHGGWFQSDEAKKKISIANKGRKPSEYCILKLKETISGKPSPFKGKNHSKENKLKMSESHLGRKMSEETKNKISCANKNNINLAHAKGKTWKLVEGKRVWVEKI